MNIRFTQVVESAGKPDPHLVFAEPSKDRELQNAIKAHRVMTVYQTTTGHAADHAKVGFDPGPSRQYLIFPKSLARFAKEKVIGIKYDLLDSGPSQPSRRRAKPPKKRPARRKARKPDNIVYFPKAEPAETAESEEVSEMKAQIRRAMKELEKGREVAAFNLLKEIVGE